MKFSVAAREAPETRWRRANPIEFSARIPADPDPKAGGRLHRASALRRRREQERPAALRDRPWLFHRPDLGSGGLDRGRGLSRRKAQCPRLAMGLASSDAAVQEEEISEIR